MRAARNLGRFSNYRIPGAAYNDKQRRNEEKTERAYQVFVAHWQPPTERYASPGLMMSSARGARSSGFEDVPVLGAVKIVRPVGRCI
jgi:hypothetical protein